MDQLSITKDFVTVSKMSDPLEITRITRGDLDGEEGPDEYYENCPRNFDQPSIFELTRQETMKKMGKVTKEAVIQKVLQKVKFIRDSDIPMPLYDPSMEPDLDLKPPIDELNKENYDGANTPCVNNFPYCQLGCVCDSVNCPDMYDEHYEKHCRDTGDPDCMYGCICEHPGPHLNGESKWITCRPYKYKKQRAKDDEDCGFVPIHLREQMREGRPKRKAQAPTRYRPDYSISEKEIRAYENGNSNSSSNGFSKRTSRPRRRLCEQEDDDSDDSDERIISDKKRMNRRDGSDCPNPPKKGRPTKQQSIRNLREPSKRERKPRNLDIPDSPDPKRPYQKTGSMNGTSRTPSEMKDDEEENEVTVALGLSLRVIDIQPASRTCQGMFGVLRKHSSEIMTLVTWDVGGNSRPYVQDLKFKFTSSRAQSEWVDGTDLLSLPNVITEDTMWLFYAVKQNFRNWDTIVCQELHAILKSQLLHELIERNRIPAIQNGASRVIEISHLNSNRRHELDYRCGPLFLYLGKKGDVFLFGVPPKIFIDKNLDNGHVVIKKKQVVHRRPRNTAESPCDVSLLLAKPKLQVPLKTFGISPALNSSPVSVTPSDTSLTITPLTPKSLNTSQNGELDVISVEIFEESGSPTIATEVPTEGTIPIQESPSESLAVEVATEITTGQEPPPISLYSPENESSPEQQLTIDIEEDHETELTIHESLDSTADVKELTTPEVFPPSPEDQVNSAATCEL